MGLPVGFADPWEHIRLLSDRRRNTLLEELLRRRAPGARVLEVGCGTGLLSCIAAKAGATRVYGVEPTARIADARALVAANGLGDRVELLEAMVEDLEPRPVELAFSELLNADPFLEGLLEASDAAARWVVPGGLLAPGRLRVLAAPVRATANTAEAEAARREITRLAAPLGLKVAPLLERIGDAGTYRYVAEVDDVVGSSVVLWEVALGRGWRPPEEHEVTLPVVAGEQAGGVVVWFEAEYEPGSWLANPPGEGGHWGQLVSGWTEPPAARRGGLRVRVEVEDGELTVHPG